MSTGLAFGPRPIALTVTLSGRPFPQFNAKRLQFATVATNHSLLLSDATLLTQLTANTGKSLNDP